jgi:ribosome maturation factor RimP
MLFGHESLKGLDRARVISVIEPVLRAHGVGGVELIWRSDPGGWVLYLTVERPEAKGPGEGITLDLCAEISRDLSSALDVADAMPARYRLDVGSPGLDRALYAAGDYQRFAGRRAKIKLRDPLEGQRVLTGDLGGVDTEGHVVLTADGREHRFDFEQIESGRLSFDWQAERSKAQPGSRGRSFERRPPARPRDR